MGTKRTCRISMIASWHGRSSGPQVESDPKNGRCSCYQYTKKCFCWGESSHIAKQHIFVLLWFHYPSLVLRLLHISPNHPPLLWIALTVLDIWRLVSPLAMFLSLQASTGLNPKGLARPKSVTFCWCKLVSLMQSRQPKTWFLQRGHMLVLCSGTSVAEIRHVSTAWISSAESLNQRFCSWNPKFFFISQQKLCLFGSDGQEFRRVKTRCLGQKPGRKLQHGI